MTSVNEITTMHQRLLAQTAEANTNELILRRAQKRELSLLDANSLVELFRRITIGLGDSFGIPASTLVLCDPEHEVRHLVTALSNQQVPPGILLVDKLDAFPGIYERLAKPWLTEQ
ncbi:MAG: hypothetical protein OES99_03220 [Gammaproteobacteria bacterium]|nr:hypothetical protein [Gammaproteobacteria bacterium]